MVNKHSYVDTLFLNAVKKSTIPIDLIKKYKSVIEYSDMFSFSDIASVSILNNNTFNAIEAPNGKIKIYVTHELCTYFDNLTLGKGIDDFISKGEFVYYGRLDRMLFQELLEMNRPKPSKLFNNILILSYTFITILVASIIVYLLYYGKYNM